MAHKLAIAGRHSRVPFTASPIYITSQVAAPVLASCRVFIPLRHWIRDGVMDVAREIACTIGPGEQFDIGLAPEESEPTGPAAGRSGEPGRVTKIDPSSPIVVLRMEGLAWRAEYPRLDFAAIGYDEWRSHVDRGIAANPVTEQATLA
jgi:hypothetical protein